MEALGKVLLEIKLTYNPKNNQNWFLGYPGNYTLALHVISRYKF